MDMSSQPLCPQCKSPLPEQLPDQMCPFCHLPIIVVAGKYSIKKKIGEGGFGLVYLAKHLHLTINPYRAIKFLPPQFMQNEQLRERFYQEILLTAGVSQENEHIVRVFDDFGVVPNLGAFYVMEYLEGQSLQEMLTSSTEPLPLSLIMHMFKQVCSALVSAHANNIIHRDLKPENILLTKRGRDPHFVKVLDFGIAKFQESSEIMTNPGEGALGTPVYMAPEQILTSSIDHRTDLYALGILLYEMLTKQTPFVDPSQKSVSLVKLMERQLYFVPQPPSGLRTDVPPEVDFLVMHCLQKQPDDRPQSIYEVLEYLDRMGETLEELQTSSSPVQEAEQQNREEIASILEPFFAFEKELAAKGPGGGAASVTPQTNPRIHTHTGLEHDPDERTSEGERYIFVFMSVMLLLFLFMGGVGVYQLFLPPKKQASPLRRRAVTVRLKKVTPRRPVKATVPVRRRTPPQRPVLRKSPPSRRLVKRRRRPVRRRKRISRSRPRRVVVRKVKPRMRADIPSTRIKGCPKDPLPSRWIYLSVRPFSARFSTKSTYIRFASWYCLMQSKPGEKITVNMTAPGYQPCSFQKKFHKRKWRLVLKKNADGLSLDDSVDYCVQGR
ncbi:MAG TPA: hypothetical protein DCE42_19675 [Myxococcales bacterium]|nr:hypothetical protein [Deltaproteobacteria bacterium]MBU52126.1 hypothetical protein [Deltaproteobacteria bacterium]HAA56996.1 hypothetical protein [Myxococcales bacterium]|tara:strand:+ start:5873 stop:7699 length:1827 start_codon:yes stop_codon:yes gene_type:complete